MSFDLILYKVFFNQFILLYSKLYTEGMLLSCTIPTLSPITILETDMQLQDKWMVLTHEHINSAMHPTTLNMSLQTLQRFPLSFRFSRSHVSPFLSWLLLPFPPTSTSKISTLCMKATPISPECSRPSQYVTSSI